MSAILLWFCAAVSASNANPAFVQVNAATPLSQITEDMPVTAAGSYSATASLTGAAAWVMQVAAFKSVSSPALVQVNAAMAPSQSVVVYAKAQAAGDTNILAIGWDATSNITSVTDSAGNTYQVAVPTAKMAGGLSQAIYYANNIKAAAAGANTVTVTFNTAAPVIDISATEYSGLDPANPLDVGRSASGVSATSNSLSVTTVAASELIFGAGITVGKFSAAGTGFTSRNITIPPAQVVVAYVDAQAAGDTNILAIGWSNATSNINAVIDSAGNTYQPAVPTARGAGLSQAIYYAKNIKAAAPGTNIVTVTFDTAAPFTDIRATEYSGLDPANPLDVGGSTSGTSATPNSGPVTTTAANELIFGAGITAGGFSAAGPGFTSRIITTLNIARIAEDMSVAAAGSYSATASLTGSAAWVMQVAAFKCGNCQPPAAIDVVTHHYDNLRTGWNSQESVLQASNVKSATFGLLHSVAVDDQVDAQPLLLTNQQISGVSGNRTVVYVATEGNTIYAIDASNGAVLLSKNFGTPVSQSVLGNCNNNAVNIGINSTPVIDRAAGRLYVVIYTSDAGVPTYRLHALDLTTLADAIPPVVVTASHTLVDGTTYTFMANKDRQRAALLEANGNIYVGFASFCDFFGHSSRGWVLGWNASTLTPLAANQLNNKLANTTNGFLSSVWMSGGGLAASAGGGIFFATGNSDNGSYDSVNNLQESVVRMSSDLIQVMDFFTPSNVNTMGDSDLSSGGVLLLPTQSGPIANLAVALGKDGRMFLMNQQNLGQFTPTGPDKVLGTFTLPACWCAESYFTGSDGVARVVSSAGNNVVFWKLQTSPSVTLVMERKLSALATGQDGGFFTSVSSNGTQAGTGIIWAVSRPTDTNPANVVLYAFNAGNGSLIFSANAGTWPNLGGNANIVPVVANGQVFVASNKQLAIFGPITAGAAAATLAQASSAMAISQIPAQGNQLSGRVLQVNGAALVIQPRSGSEVTIDARPALDAFQSVPIVEGEAITAEGKNDAQGLLHAQTIVRAKDSPALWPPDR